MTSEPVRDPLADHLLTPQNCALIIIDYQPTQIRSIKSMDQDLLVDRVVHLARFGMLYRLPVVLSTVNVSTGRNQPTIGPLQDVLPGITALDRTTINAWEDAEFKQAVRAAGRRKLIMAALWTEACLTFPSLDAMREGYQTTRWPMPSAGHHQRRTRPGWTASPWLAASRPVWSRWVASCSATGVAREPRRASRRSCSAGSGRWPGGAPSRAGHTEFARADETGGRCRLGVRRAPEVFA